MLELKRIRKGQQTATMMASVVTFVEEFHGTYKRCKRVQLDLFEVGRPSVSIRTIKVMESR